MHEHTEPVVVVGGNLEPAPLGQVTGDDDDAGDLRIVEQVRADDLEVAPPAIRGLEPDVDRAADSLATDGLERHQCHREVVGVHDLERVATDPVFALPAERA